MIKKNAKNSHVRTLVNLKDFAIKCRYYQETSDYYSWHIYKEINNGNMYSIDSGKCDGLFIEQIGELNNIIHKRVINYLDNYVVA